MQEWCYEKFKGNMGIFAICPVCGYHHGGVSNIGPSVPREEVRIMGGYNYCPMCGTFLRPKDIDHVEIVWEQRSITDLFEMEENNVMSVWTKNGYRRCRGLSKKKQFERIRRQKKLKNGKRFGKIFG